MLLCHVFVGKEKRGLFTKKRKTTQSMDDAEVSAPRGVSVRRQTSETDLAADFLGVTSDKNKSASKVSLLDRCESAQAPARLDVDVTRCCRS